MCCRSPVSRSNRPRGLGRLAPISKAAKVDWCSFNVITWAILHNEYELSRDSESLAQQFDWWHRFSDCCPWKEKPNDTHGGKSRYLRQALHDRVRSFTSRQICKYWRRHIHDNSKNQSPKIKTWKLKDTNHGKLCSSCPLLCRPPVATAYRDACCWNQQNQRRYCGHGRVCSAPCLPIQITKGWYDAPNRRLMRVLAVNRLYLEASQGYVDYLFRYSYVSSASLLSL